MAWRLSGPVGAVIVPPVYPPFRPASPCRPNAALGNRGIPAKDAGVSHSVVDDLLYEARLYAARFGQPHSVVPDKHLAIVTCMDSRIDVFGLFGLAIGDAHIIRNAGGVVTEDAIRSLTISQRLLGTTEIILIHHTDCGMLTFTDDEFKAGIQKETGIKPEWAAEAFADPAEDVLQSIARIKASPFIPKKDSVRGFVFDMATGRLEEVAA